MQLLIQRFTDGPDYTFGRFNLLNDNNKIVYKGFTLEPAGPESIVDTDDARIPLGTYDVSWEQTDLYGGDLIGKLPRLDNIAKSIFIIAGDTGVNTEGDIIVGSSINEEAGVIFSSKATLYTLINLTYDTVLDQPLPLTVVISKHSSLDNPGFGPDVGVVSANVEANTNAIKAVAQSVTALETTVSTKVDQTAYDTKVAAIESKANNAIYRGRNVVNNQVVNLNSDNGKTTAVTVSMLDIEMLRLGRDNGGNFNMQLGGGTNQQLGSQKLLVKNFRGGINLENNVVVTGSNTLTVGGINVANKFGALDTALDTKADKADTYTKDEVNDKIAAASHFKGVVDTRADLPSTDNTPGDIRVIRDADNLMVAWDGTGWDDLSNVDVDLSDYMTITDFNTEKDTLNASIDTKVDQTAYDTKVAELQSDIDAKVDQTAYDTKVAAIETKANNAIYKGRNLINNQVVNLNSDNGKTTAVTVSMLDIEMLRLGRDNGGNFNMQLGGGTNQQLGSQKLLVKNFRGGINLENNVTVTGSNTLTVGGVNVANKFTALDTALDTKANADSVVNLVDSQAIDGTKTFNESPVVPEPIDDTHAATKKYVDDAVANVDLSAVDARVTANETLLTNHTARIDQNEGNIDLLADFMNNTIKETVDILAVSVNTHNKNYKELKENKADKADTYTKDEVDEKVRAASHYKGVVATRADLPDTDNTTGDIRIIQDENNLMVAWNGTTWDDLSNVEVDLSDYVSKAELATDKAALEAQIADKIDTSTYDTGVAEMRALLNGKVDTTTLADYATSADLTTSLDEKVDKTAYDTKVTAIETKANNAIYKGANAVSGRLFSINGNAGQRAYISVETQGVNLCDVGRGEGGNFHIYLSGNGSHGSLTGQQFVVRNFRGGISLNNNVIIPNGSLTVGGINVKTKIETLEATVAALTARIEALEGNQP